MAQADALSGLAAPPLSGIKADIPRNHAGCLVANRDGDDRRPAAKLPTQPEPSPYPTGARRPRGRGPLRMRKGRGRQRARECIRQRFTITGWNRKAATVPSRMRPTSGQRDLARMPRSAWRRKCRPCRNAAIEQEGPDLVDGGGALAHQAATNRCSACRSSRSTGSHINQLVHYSLGDCWVVVAHCNFSRAAFRWNLTVRSLMPKITLASQAVFPAAVHFKQSSSLADIRISLSQLCPFIRSTWL